MTGRPGIGRNPAAAATVLTALLTTVLALSHGAPAAATPASVIDDRAGAAAAALPPLGDGLAVVSRPNGITFVYARGLDDALWYRQRPPGEPWQPWFRAPVQQPLQGHSSTMTAGPGVAQNFGSGHHTVFSLGPNDGGRAVMRLSYTPPVYGSWSYVGPGALLSTPAAAQHMSEDWVYGRGIDGALWEQRSALGVWTSLGGVITESPATVVTNDGLYVLARGQDGALWSRFKSNSGVWSPWTFAGGVLTSGPGAVVTGATGFAVFARGQDGAMWTQEWTGTGWTGWSSLGGTISSAPAAGWPEISNVEVFARGQDGAVWTRRRAEGTWQPWESLGGNVR